MTVYAVHVQILTRAADGYAGSRGVPTFYLDSRVQGITGPEHAAAIAAQVVNPMRAIAAGDVQVFAVPVDPQRESAELDAWQAEQTARAEHDSACQDAGHATWCAGPVMHLPA